MSLTQTGAESMIAEFGEEVLVTPVDNDVAEDSNDPIFIDSSGSESAATEYRVRLYTTPADEMLEDYGFDDNTEAIMYSTDDIANIGDKVEYEPLGHEWIVDKISTNQIGRGPYIYVYKMVGI